MRYRSVSSWLLLGLATTLLFVPANAEEGSSRPAAAAAAPDVAAAAEVEPAGGDAEADKLAFVRFQPDAEGGGTLDTAIASYRNADGVVVHLVAAVHVGEKGYYSELSETFDTYDALLYELVKPRGSPAPGTREPARPAGGTRIRGATAIGGLQGLLKNALELESQLESINYDRPNFVHADLDVETFNEMQEARGESLFRLMLRSMVSEMNRQQKGKGAAPITMFDLLAAMGSPDSARQYKLLLARQMKDVEAQMEGIEGKNGSVIISERNKAALKVLERTIGEGKKNIGVFYGAGHMRGIEDELVEKMGFERTGVEWRVAWDMRAGEAEKAKGGGGRRRLITP